MVPLFQLRPAEPAFTSVPSDRSSSTARMKSILWKAPLSVPSASPGLPGQAAIPTKLSRKSSTASLKPNGSSLKPEPTSSMSCLKEITKSSHWSQPSLSADVPKKAQFENSNLVFPTLVFSAARVSALLPSLLETSFFIRQFLPVHRIHHAMLIASTTTQQSGGHAGHCQWVTLLVVVFPPSSAIMLCLHSSPTHMTPSSCCFSNASKQIKSPKCPSQSFGSSRFSPQLQALS